MFSSPVLPTIPPGTFNITTYGASTASTDNTAAIQNTINAAHAAGGGTVVIPSGSSGAYLSGPLTMYSSIDLQINGELQMLAYGTYPGSTSFITGTSLTNVEVSGTGTIDGQGSPWWTAYNANNAVVRPCGMIDLSTCSYVEIVGITLTNPPNTHIDVGNECSNVTINNININTPVSPNTDGIDMAANTAVIENCSISDGDDNIAIGGSRGEGSTDVTVINDTFGIGHGLSIGSYTSGSVNGLTVNNCTFTGTTAGIRIKSERGRGGLVANLSYSNLTMTNVQYPIDINGYYNQRSVPSTPQDPPQAVTASSYTPNYQNITISNVTSTDSATNSYCGIIWGLPELPIENISLNNVRISAHYGFDLDHVRNIHFDSLCAVTPATGGIFISTTSAATPYDAVFWNDNDINKPAVAGNGTTNTSNSVYTVSGGGGGIGGSSDQFNLDSTPLTSDGTLLANLTGQSAGTGNQAGVMMRASNSSTATFAAVLLNGSGGAIFQDRVSGTVNTISAAGPASWVKLVRSGGNYSGYCSSNGTTWTQLGSTISTTMTGSILAGLVSTSGNNTAGAPLNSAVFSNVELLQVSTTALPASASLNTSSTQLTVYASDALNDSGLTYTWSATTIPPGATAPTYSANGTNTSNYTTVNFTGPGNYIFTMTAKSASGLTVTSSTASVVVSIPLTMLTGTSGLDTISLVRSGSLLDIYYNNPSTPAYALTDSTQGAITIDGGGGTDSITMNFSGGSPVPAAGLDLLNTGGSNALTLIGTTGVDVAVINSSGLTFDGAQFSYSNAGTLALDIGSSASATITQTQAGGPALSLIGSNTNDAVYINAGSMTIAGPAVGKGIVPYSLGTLNISSGAKVTLQTDAASSDRTVLVLGGLSIGSNGLLDIGGNDMLIHQGSLTGISQWVAKGMSGTNRTGTTGITSGAAATDSTHLTSIGAIQNSVDGTTSGAVLYNAGSALGTFDGQVGINTDVLVRYTYVGDVTLSGDVTSSDYSRIDAAYLEDRNPPGGITGWFNGDFNYDSSINGSDYTLIDNAFNTQGMARPAAFVAAKINSSVATHPRQMVHAADQGNSDDPSKKRKQTLWEQLAQGDE